MDELITKIKKFLSETDSNEYKNISPLIINSSIKDDTQEIERLFSLLKKDPEIEAKSRITAPYIGQLTPDQFSFRLTEQARERSKNEQKATKKNLFRKWAIILTVLGLVVTVAMAIINKDKTIIINPPGPIPGVNDSNSRICEVKITKPADSSQVKRTEFISGEAILPPNAHLWILVRPKGSNDFWPQGYGALYTKNWNVFVYFGDENDYGAFEIVAMIVGDKSNKALENWIQTSANTKPPYQPISLPAAIASCSMKTLSVYRIKDSLPPNDDPEQIKISKKELKEVREKMNQIEENLIITSDYAQAYRAYLNLYNSLSPQLQKKISEKSLEEANRQYNKPGNPESRKAAEFMRKNIELALKTN